MAWYQLFQPSAQGANHHPGTAKKIKGPWGYRQWECNLAAVWRQMATGGGHTQLEETMSTLGVPVMTKSSFIQSEHSIRECWRQQLQKSVAAAGEEEKRLAKERRDYHECIPAITVIIDGGWSKPSYIHSYNTKSVVAIIGQHWLVFASFSVWVLLSFCDWLVQFFPNMHDSTFRHGLHHSVFLIAWPQTGTLAIKVGYTELSPSAMKRMYLTPCTFHIGWTPPEWYMFPFHIRGIQFVFLLGDALSACSAIHRCATSLPVQCRCMGELGLLSSPGDVCNSVSSVDFRQPTHEERTPCYCHYLLEWRLLIQVEYSSRTWHTNCSILSPMCGDGSWRTSSVIQCRRWSCLEKKCAVIPKYDNLNFS